MSNEYPYASMRDSFDLSAYFVVGPEDCKGRPLTDVVDQALRGGADGKRREGRVANLAARPAQPRQPEQRADGKRLRRGAGRSAGRTGDVLRTILRQADHRRRGAAD